VVSKKVKEERNGIVCWSLGEHMTERRGGWHMNKLAYLVAAILVVLAQGVEPCVGDSSDVLKQGYVTPEWLEEYANDPDLIIVDVSFDRKDFEKEHIPNAVYIDWRRDLADQREEKYYRIVPMDEFEKVMSSIGAEPDKTIIFYDNKQNRLSIRAVWVAHYYGHERAVILEGGIAAWKSAGFELTNEVVRVEPTKYKVQETHSEMNVEKQFVKQNLQNQGLLSVDSRPRRMYTGEIPGKIIHTGQEVARRGHLPGAVNIPWKSNLNKQSLFLDKGMLLKMYTEKGVTNDKLTVFYCNEGLHAVFNWFVATKLLGFKKVKIYEGSMGEWADDPLLPMVSGVGF
jgi:thiosulfate/3-mercaptopyruvate sulfurtransferase